MPPIKITIEKEPEFIEITLEEYEMIIRAREKQRKKARQAELIAELNDLLARMRAEGFAILSNGCRDVQRAEPWKCDTTNHFIDIIA